MEIELERLQLLFGNDQIEKISRARVAVIGLGGVGGPAVECLVRSGIKQLLLVDHDVVQSSNLNRQVLYSQKDIGELKAISAYQRISDIASNVNITTSTTYIDNSNLTMLEQFKPDYIIDAIDSIQGKTALICWAAAHGVSIISSLGMGNRIIPSKIIITTIDKTNNDPLAKALRLSLRKERIDLKQVNVVFSTEVPIRKKMPVGSYMAVTASAGLLLAHHIIDTIIKKAG